MGSKPSMETSLVTGEKFNVIRKFGFQKEEFDAGLRELQRKKECAERKIHRKSF